ncbi:MAG: PAS domain-containing protein [Comamonadaceae bacterium]|nr:MAG: PAS domain-containing protein [Comamonadaceae bacterium]
MIALELLSDGVLVLDNTWHILACNSRAAELMHTASADLTGGDFWEAMPEEVAEQHRQPVEAALRIDDSHVLVARHVFEDQWVEYSFRRHGEGCVVTLRDATESQKIMHRLRDSEHRNFVLFGLNPTVMWIFDVDTLKVTAVNQAAVDFYGIRQKKFLTLHVTALFPDQEAAPLVEQALGARSRTPQPARLLLCRQKLENGTLALAELACNAIEWKGRPCMLVSLADVSERHLADAGLRQLNDELLQQQEQRALELQVANRDLDAFAQAMSHDLKDPLHVLNGFARALSRKYAGVLDVQGQHYVERIQATTRQLAKLVDDLRTLARLPRLPLVNEAVDLAPICAALMRDLRKRDPDRGDVLLEIEPNLVVNGDRDLLTMALTHLLENAWKFTARKPQAWIRIGFVAADTAADAGRQPARVSLRQAQREPFRDSGRQLLLDGENPAEGIERPESRGEPTRPRGPLPGEKVLSVADNGVGFDLAYQDKLFMAFQRLHSSADFAGNGLGLVIVRRSVLRMQGRVWAESVEGAGATFFIALAEPAKGQDAAPASEQAPAPEPRIPAIPPIRSVPDVAAAAPLTAMPAIPVLPDISVAVDGKDPIQGQPGDSPAGKPEK